MGWSWKPRGECLFYITVHWYSVGYGIVSRQWDSFSAYIQNYFKWEQYWHKIICCCRSQNVSRVDLEINFPYRSTHQREVWRTFKCSPWEETYLIKRPACLWCLFSDAKKKKMLLSSFHLKISGFLKLLLPYFNVFPPQNQGLVCTGWEDWECAPQQQNKQRQKQNKWGKQNRTQSFPSKCL